MFEQILRDITEQLRSLKWPKICQENVDAGIIYLDCARQNLINLSKTSTISTLCLRCSRPYFENEIILSNGELGCSCMAGQE